MILNYIIFNKSDATKIYVYTVNIDKSIHFSLGKPIQVIAHRTTNVLHNYILIECCYIDNYYYISLAVTESISNMLLTQISATTDIYYIK